MLPPPEDWCHLAGLSVNLEETVPDLPVFARDENRSPIRRPSYRPPDVFKLGRKVPFLVRLERADRDDLWAVPDQARAPARVNPPGRACPMSGFTSSGEPCGFPSTTRRSQALMVPDLSLAKRMWSPSGVQPS